MKRNDSEREQWVNNDEGLYEWQRRSHLSMRQFVRENRDTIDRFIDGETKGKRTVNVDWL